MEDTGTFKLCEYTMMADGTFLWAEDTANSESELYTQNHIVPDNQDFPSSDYTTFHSCDLHESYSSDEGPHMKSFVLAESLKTSKKTSFLLNDCQSTYEIDATVDIVNECDEKDFLGSLSSEIHEYSSQLVRNPLSQHKAIEGDSNAIKCDTIGEEIVTALANKEPPRKKRGRPRKLHPLPISGECSKVVTTESKRTSVVHKHFYESKLKISMKKRFAKHRRSYNKLVGFY